jgi:hypothetical protein
MKRTKLIFLIAGLILTKLSFAQVDSLVFIMATMILAR